MRAEKKRLARRFYKPILMKRELIWQRVQRVQRVAQGQHYWRLAQGLMLQVRALVRLRC